MNSKTEASLGALSVVVHKFDGLYEKLAQKQGTTYNFVQIYYIIKFNRASTQKEISDLWQVPKQTVNNVIKKLIADKHIILISNKEDKREKIIKLTPLGEAYTQELLKPYFELNELLGKRVGIDLINKLSEGFTTLADALEMEIELKEVSSKYAKKKKKQYNKKEK